MGFSGDVGSGSSCRSIKSAGSATAQGRSLLCSSPQCEQPSLDLSTTASSWAAGKPSGSPWPTTSGFYFLSKKKMSHRGNLSTCKMYIN